MAKAHHKNSAFCLLPSAFASAFTLLEIMIAVGVFFLVVAGSLSVYIMCQRMWRATSLSMDTSRMANLAIQRIVYGVATNSGLQSAASVSHTNAYGHTHLMTTTNNYWETGAPQPLASNTYNYTHAGCAWGADGSWRLIISNTTEGVKYLDYNSKARSMLFCPDINQTTAARQKRLLICNYVSSSTAMVNSAAGTVEIQLTVWKRDGDYVGSNQASTLVKLRNFF